MSSTATKTGKPGRGKAVPPPLRKHSAVVPAAPGRRRSPDLVIAVTSGEPAGIGPDICLSLSARRLGARMVVLGDRHLLRARARRLGLRLAVRDFEPGRPRVPGELSVMHVALLRASRPGTLDAGNSRYVLSLIDAAVDGCTEGIFSAMVTAPVHKGVINDAGIPFIGHTEYLAERTGTPHVVMMLTGAGLRVALATTHLPLRRVAQRLTAANLERTVRVLHGALRNQFGIGNPRILVAGLNPHGGESGHIGREEIDVINPVLDRLRREGMSLEGPIPADTLFTPSRLADCDCALAMYHDQGLPVLKYASFGKGINITLGLPIIRTSVDHGTALELAGTGEADSGSLVAAVRAAITMARASAWSARR